jgi:hypothetical protein
MARVLGAPLVERSLLALLKARISEVTLLVTGSAKGGGPLHDWARGRGQLLAQAAGGRVRLVSLPDGLADSPALTDVAGSDGLVVQVRADNLSALDLGVPLEAHERTWADLTLAIHDQAFRLPYGVVQQDDGRVTGYLDDAVAAVPVASGIAVLGRRALALVGAGASLTDPADLVARGVERGLSVRTLAHKAAWIHADDTHALEMATRLVRADPAAFELFWQSPVPLTAIPGSGDPSVRFDDIDPSGRPCRVEVPEKQGPGTSDVVAQLSPGAAARARAWLAERGAGLEPAAEDDGAISLPAEPEAAVHPAGSDA